MTHPTYAELDQIANDINLLLVQLIMNQIKKKSFAIVEKIGVQKEIDNKETNTDRIGDNHQQLPISVIFIIVCLEFYLLHTFTNTNIHQFTE